MIIDIGEVIDLYVIFKMLKNAIKFVILKRILCTNKLHHLYNNLLKIDFMKSITNSIVNKNATTTQKGHNN